jgi:hypothetical protein
VRRRTDVRDRAVRRTCRACAHRPCHRDDRLAGRRFDAWEGRAWSAYSLYVRTTRTFGTDRDVPGHGDAHDGAGRVSVARSTVVVRTAMSYMCRGEARPNTAGNVGAAYSTTSAADIEARGSTRTM